jgi:hypothetical protein
MEAKYSSLMQNLSKLEYLHTLNEDSILEKYYESILKEQQ